jgi:Uncharacterized conserved protein
MAQFTAVIEKRDDWYVGYVEELPGVNTQGRTLKEVRENLREALQLIIEANRELAAQSQGAYQSIKEPIQVEI